MAKCFLEKAFRNISPGVNFIGTPRQTHPTRPETKSQELTRKRAVWTRRHARAHARTRAPYTCSQEPGPQPSRGSAAGACIAPCDCDGSLRMSSGMVTAIAWSSCSRSLPFLRRLPSTWPRAVAVSQFQGRRTRGVAARDAAFSPRACKGFTRGFDGRVRASTVRVSKRSRSRARGPWGTRRSRAPSRCCRTW